MRSAFNESAMQKCNVPLQSHVCPTAAPPTNTTIEFGSPAIAIPVEKLVTETIGVNANAAAKADEENAPAVTPADAAARLDLVLNLGRGPHAPPNRNKFFIYPQPSKIRII